MKGVIKTPAFEDYVDDRGVTRQREKLCFTGIVVWSGAGTTAGDLLENIAVGTVGFNNDAASTANVYIYTGSAWSDTTQTVAGFFGA